MKTVKSRFFIILTLLLGINALPQLACAKESWNKITVNDETCSYKFENDSFIKRCTRLSTKKDDRLDNNQKQTTTFDLYKDLGLKTILLKFSSIYSSLSFSQLLILCGIVILIVFNKVIRFKYRMWRFKKHWSYRQTQVNQPQIVNGSINTYFLLIPCITLGLLWYAADTFIVKPPPIEISGSGDITIPADRSGHYRGTVLINSVAMPFVIDTGATLTTIPVNMAIKAGLSFGRNISMSTANGQVSNPSTFINSLRLGNIEIKNIDASIMLNPGLEAQVLIGMNTLKYFRMVQDKNRLTLTANAPR